MNFLQTLIDLLATFWPFAIVEEWERGVYYILGHAMKWDLKPGLYPFVPWFMRLVPVSVVPAPFSTPLLNITMRDGKPLGYSATAVVRVTNPWKALNKIEDYRVSVCELLASRTSEKLADVDAGRLEPEGRRRLITDLLRWLNEDTSRYGVEVQLLRFTNFAVNQRAYRLLVDTALTSTVWD